MDAFTLVTLSLALLFVVVLFFRMPVSIALALLGAFGYLLLDGPANALRMLATEVWSVFTSTEIMAIPFFLLMGNICSRSGLYASVYQGLAACFGRRRGGLAVATLLAGAGFAGTCSSATTATTAISVAASPAMTRAGYSPVMTDSTTAAGSWFSGFLPPSILALMLAYQGDLPIQHIFAGGFVPALLLLVLCLFTVPVLGFLRPTFSPALTAEASSQTSLSPTGLAGIFECLTLFLFITGGIFFGFITPVETGALGALLALLLAVLGRSFSFMSFCKAVVDALRHSAILFLLLAGAALYWRFITLANVQTALLDMIHALPFSPLALMAILCAFSLVGVMLMHPVAFMLVFFPFFSSLAAEVGYSKVWLCSLMLVIASFGLVTAAMATIPADTKKHTAKVFLPAFILCIVLLLLFPQLIMYIPQLIM